MFREAAGRAGEVRDVDLHVVAVIFALRPIGLAEQQLLALSGLHARDGADAVPEFGRHSHDLRIESANPLRASDRHVELDIGNAERDASETRGVRLIAAHAIAPWA